MRSVLDKVVHDLLGILEVSDVVRIVQRKEEEAFFAMSFDDLRTCRREDCDFIVEGLSVEISERTKSSSADLVFKDGVDIGYRNSIPLYLVGFLK